MKSILFSAIILITISQGCHRDPDQSKRSSKHIKEIEKNITEPESYFSKNEHMVLGTLYHQQAAEYRALCYQAYNIGRMILDKDLEDKTVDKHRIVILDIDETVLDNSPYEAACILQDINYPTRWEEWCTKASAEAVPGSLEFLNYARSSGVSVFYVTNRKQNLKDQTIRNLQKLGFPQADEEHVIMRTTENSKEGRRQVLADKYHIALLFGDNLSDFTNVFDDNNNGNRIKKTDELYKEFGKRFIILPNSTYGDWETNLYMKADNPSDSMKTILRHQVLRGF
ncbi:MAG TPA: 5'-nucleotidase, lipoprotein e(P4) family [Lentimicrobium sp.]|nr:5'-nucleotidase, lipoprotein e(P4) family [Lentimicrobium sp.]